ncbi:splicing factor [Tanacetum coccineum]
MLLFHCRPILGVQKKHVTIRKPIVTKSRKDDEGTKKEAEESGIKGDGEGTSKEAYESVIKGDGVGTSSSPSVKEGWIEGFRRIIGLDGCFLKRTCRRELLTATGGDVNNQTYPIAWVVVKVENHENWSWFLGLMHYDLNLDHGAGLTVISDAHKL